MSYNPLAITRSAQSQWNNHYYGYYPGGCLTAQPGASGTTTTTATTHASQSLTWSKWDEPQPLLLPRYLKHIFIQSQFKLSILIVFKSQTITWSKWDEPQPLLLPRYHKYTFIQNSIIKLIYHKHPFPSHTQSKWTTPLPTTRGYTSHFNIFHYYPFNTFIH